MKHPVIAMRVYSGEDPFNIKLPEGCEGVALIFESKKAAREYWGEDIGLLRIDWEVEYGTI